MKRHIRTATWVLALTLAIPILAATLATPVQAEVSFGVFYSSLSPHGSWLVSSSYGRVWQPAVYASGWNPYYDGHWVYTDLGWSWVSDYPWGGIPYHYGTWVADPGLGWVWVPGYVWAPSWVVFRTSPTYIGWAPVPPGYIVGTSFNVSGSNFVFVPSNRFVAPTIRTYVVPERTARTIVNKTKVVNAIRIENNLVVNRGPDIRVVEKVSGTKLRAAPIESVSRVGPGAKFSRSDVRVEATKQSRAPKVTSPYSAREPLPSMREMKQPKATEGSKSGKPEAGRPPAKPQKQPKDAKPGAPHADK